MAARRPSIRWAWRLFRREWRQQILVVTLLTVAVAAAIGSITIAYNSGPADEQAEFGSASQLLEFDGADPRELEAGLAAARKSVRNDRRRSATARSRPRRRREGGVPRRRSRAAPMAASCLTLRRGNYPVGPGQVAVTDGVAEFLRLEIGSTLALDGRRRTVVGIVENPRELSDEFALVSPASAAAPDHVMFSSARRRCPSPSCDPRMTAPAGLGGRIRAEATSAVRQRRADVLRGHRLPAPGFARCRRGLRSRRAATAPPARHARCRSAPPRSTSDSCCSTNGAVVGDDRRPDRDDRGSRALGRIRPDTRVRGRPSPRPAQPALATARDGRPRRDARGDSRCLVAGASGRPRPRHARPLGAAAQAETRTPLGDRRSQR